MSNTKPKLRTEGKQLYMTPDEMQEITREAARTSMRTGKSISVNALLRHFINYGLKNKLADKL